MICFFSDERNFDQDQQTNIRIDRWLCADPSNVAIVVRTKATSIVMVLVEENNEGHAMLHSSTETSN